MKADEFLRMITTEGTVAQQVDISYKKNVQENRQMLTTIIKSNWPAINIKSVIVTISLCLLPPNLALILLGKHDLPLRGHIDSGEFQLCDPPHNDGVFRALLRLLGRSGDTGAQVLHLCNMMQY